MHCDVAIFVNAYIGFQIARAQTTNSPVAIASVRMKVMFVMVETTVEIYRTSFVVSFG